MKPDYRIFWESAGGSVPSHWQFVPIGALLESPKAMSVGVMYPGSDTPGGVPLVRVSDVKDGAITQRPDFCVSKEVDEEYKRSRFNGTELLITLVGNPGDCAMVLEEMAGWNAARALAVVRLKDPTLRSWLRYVLLSRPAKNLIDARLNTTVQKTLNLKDIKELAIPMPPRNERERITDIIGGLEDKILINREINRTLEQIAQTVFQSWFVSFEPVKAKVKAKAAGQDAERAAMRAISGKPGSALDQFPPEQLQELAATASLFPDGLVESELGLVPAGWEVRSLPETIEVNPSRMLKKGAAAPYLDMANVSTNSARVADVIQREFNSGSKFINGDTLLARITPCLENGKTAYVDFLDENQVGWGSTEFIVFRPKEPLPEAFVYLLCRHPEFRAFAIANMTGTSGRQRVPNDCFANYKVVVPPRSVASSFGDTVGSIMAGLKVRDEETRTLTMLRDALLPKLLSGKINLESSSTLGSEV